MSDNNEVPRPSQDPEIKPQPSNPSRRKWGIAAVGALATTFGLKKAAETTTGQQVIKSAGETAGKILNTAPGQDHSDSRPSLYKQLDEVHKNWNAMDSSKKGGNTVTEEQKIIEDRIKAENDANPANRWVKPTPSSKK